MKDEIKKKRSKSKPKVKKEDSPKEASSDETISKALPDVDFKKFLGCGG